MQYREEDHEQFEKALVNALMTAAEKTCFNHTGKEIDDCLYTFNQYSFKSMLEEFVADALFRFGADNINAHTATMEEIYNGDAK
jgi:hypothetical protein